MFRKFTSLVACVSCAASMLVVQGQPAAAASRHPRKPSVGAGVNGLFFFSATDGGERKGGHSREVWVTGEGRGTRLLKDINPNGPSDPTNFEAVGETMFFTASDGTHGYELWKSDGTRRGTLMVKDIKRMGDDAPYFAPSGLAAINDTLFFFATDGNGGKAHYRELWTSDGTKEGTRMVEDINPYFESINGPGPPRYAVVGDELFFVADDGVHWEEIWRSDGTAQGTEAVTETMPGPSAGELLNFITWGNKVAFTSFDVGLGVSFLWVSDGTEEGTTKLKTIPSLRLSLKVIRNRLFVLTGKSGLWTSDGTPNGTKEIKSHDSIAVYASPTGLNGNLFYFANDGVHGRELWISDGTSMGTRMVKDINPGEPGLYRNPCCSYPPLVAARGRIFFAAIDGQHGYELWKSDGTRSGTRLVKDVNPTGSAFADEVELTAFDREVFFGADNGNDKPELWKSNGSRRGTKRVWKR